MQSYDDDDVEADDDIEDGSSQGQTTNEINMN